MLNLKYFSILFLGEGEIQACLSSTIFSGAPPEGLVNFRETSSGGEWIQSGKGAASGLATPRLNIFRVRAGGVQGNQVHSITPEGLRITNPDFQPIPSRAKFYSIAT